MDETINSDADTEGDYGDAIVEATVNLDASSMTYTQQSNCKVEQAYKDATCNVCQFCPSISAILKQDVTQIDMTATALEGVDQLLAHQYMMIPEGQRAAYFDAPTGNL
jgi:hypothetical protein